MTRFRSGYTTVTAEVEVHIGDLLEDLSDEDLAELGLHLDEKCAAKVPVTETPGQDCIRDAIASLHRQAHPAANSDPWLCHEEPCRSLPLALVATSLSHPERSAEAYKAHLASRAGAS